MSSSAVKIPGKFGFGTMSLTWTPTPRTLEEALEIIVYSCDKHNIRFINGGEFYGPDWINVKYLLEFWKKYGQNYPDLVVCIKGSIKFPQLAPDGSKESISHSIEKLASFFPPEKSKRPVLIYEIARVDPEVPYEDTIGFIQHYVEQGVIDGISLSEVGVGSIRKASSLAPISCVEVELSLLCQDILTNGVLQELSERNITVVAYSPLCRGFLTERTANDFDSFFELCSRPGDIRGHLGKFSSTNFPHNLKIVKELQEFAHKKGTTLESLALSWIVAISESTNFYGIKSVSKVIPIPSGSTADKVDENLGQIIELSANDMKEIQAITEKNPVKGLRYSEASKHLEFA